MRNGFRSSRGAMRGTIGGVPICLVGAVGFATVAIGVGPFVYAIYLRSSVFTWPILQIRSKENSVLTICRKLLHIGGVRVAAGMGAKVEKLAPFPERNGERFVHVHAANRVAHQPARRNRGLCRRWSIRRRCLGSNVPKQPAD